MLLDVLLRAERGITYKKVWIIIKLGGLAVTIAVPRV